MLKEKIWKLIKLSSEFKYDKGLKVHIIKKLYYICIFFIVIKNIENFLHFFSK